MFEYPNLEELLEEAADAARGDSYQSPHELAALALELASIHTAVTKALEPLKEKLREEARARLPLGESEGTVILEGLHEQDPDDPQPPKSFGLVTVTFPPKQVKLPKGTDGAVLERALGSSFLDYFEKSVSYRPKKDLPDILKERASYDHNPDEISTVLSAVSYVDPTPRVGFKPADPVSPSSGS